MVFTSVKPIELQPNYQLLGPLQFLLNLINATPLLGIYIGQKNSMNFADEVKHTKFKF